MEVVREGGEPSCIPSLLWPFKPSRHGYDIADVPTLVHFVAHHLPVSHIRMYIGMVIQGSRSRDPSRFFALTLCKHSTPYCISIVLTRAKPHPPHRNHHHPCHMEVPFMCGQSICAFYVPSVCFNLSKCAFDVLMVGQNWIPLDSAITTIHSHDDTGRPGGKWSNRRVG